MKIDLAQLQFINPLLREIVLHAEKTAGMELTVTSLYRQHDSGVHGVIPLRGIDIRCRDARAGQALADKINKLWEYDPTRPEMEVCIVHGEGANLHMHFQVHPRTISREEKS